MKDQLKIILAAVIAFAGLMLFLMSYYGKKSADNRDEILEKARKAKKKKNEEPVIEEAEIVEEVQETKENKNGKK